MCLLTELCNNCIARPVSHLQAGKTFMMQAARRILNRPEGTTVLELALATTSAAARDQQQQQQQKLDPTTQDWDSTSSPHLRGTNETTKAPQKASPGLAVGPGFVLETATSTLRVYDQKSGAPYMRMPPLSLNTFLGLPNEANRTSRTFGPAVNDPSCWFDDHTERWFVATTTTDISPNGVLLANYIDLAVSDDSNPTGEAEIQIILTIRLACISAEALFIHA